MSGSVYRFSRAGRVGVQPYTAPPRCARRRISLGSLDDCECWPLVSLGRRTAKLKFGRDGCDAAAHTPLNYAKLAAAASRRPVSAELRRPRSLLLGGRRRQDRPCQAEGAAWLRVAERPQKYINVTLRVRNGFRDRIRVHCSHCRYRARCCCPRLTNLFSPGDAQACGPMDAAGSLRTFTDEVVNVSKLSWRLVWRARAVATALPQLSG